MFNFHKLIETDYLFTVNRVFLARSDKLFFVVGAALVIVAIVFKIAALYAPNPLDKILRNKFFNLFLTIGLLEVVWFGARYENIMFFGSHFLALLILLIGLVWFIFLAASIMKNYRSDKLMWEKEQVRLKYLPK
jgi:hypothetical protein